MTNKVILIWLITVTSSTTVAEWKLWPTPNSTLDIPSIEINELTNGSGVQNGHGVGQSFTTTFEHIYRISLPMKNRGDERAIQVSIWQWVDNNANGIADNSEYFHSVTQGTPVFTEQLILTGPDIYQQVDFYPNLNVQPGAMYYIEFGSPGELGTTANHAEFVLQSYWHNSAAASQPGIDRYSGGDLRVNGHFRTQLADMVFSLYSTPGNEIDAGSCIDDSTPPCTTPLAAWQLPISVSPAGKNYYATQVSSMGNAFTPAVVSGSESIAPFAMIAKAFDFRREGIDADALAVRDLFQKVINHRLSVAPGNATGFEALEHPGWSYRWVRDSTVLSAEDHRMMKTLLLDYAAEYYATNRELGFNNRVLGGILSLKLVTDLISPGEFTELSSTACANTTADYCALFSSPLSALNHSQWKQFADNQWIAYKNEWTFEDESTHYQALSWRYILGLIELYDEHDSIWASTAFVDLIENTLSTILPNGDIIVFGDTHGIGMDWASFVWLFEEAALRLQNSHYKLIAELITRFRREHFDFSTVAHADEWRAVHNEWIALAQAYFAASDSIDAINDADRFHTYATTRREFSRRLASERSLNTPEGLPQGFDILSGSINDTLILRGGSSPTDMFLTIGLSAGWQEHKHEDIGSVHAFGHNGATILTGSSINDKQLQDSSTVFSRRFSVGVLQNRPRDATIQRLDDYNQLSIAKLNWHDIDGRGIQLGREIYFIKNQFVWFRDFAVPVDPLQMRAGSIWHSAGMINPNANWYTLFNQRPEGLNGWRFYNTEQYGLLYFVPRVGYQFDSTDVGYTGGNPNSPQKITTQSYSGFWNAGEKRWFDSFLVPTATQTNANIVAASVNKLFEHGSSLAAEITVNGRTWILVDNPLQLQIETARINTDSRLTIFSHKANLEPTTDESATLYIENASSIEIKPNGAGYSLLCADIDGQLSGEFSYQRLISDRRCLHAYQVPASDAYLASLLMLLLFAIYLSSFTIIRSGKMKSFKLNKQCPRM